MRSDLFAGAVVLAGMAAAGCGGGTSSTGAHHAAVPGSGTRPTQIYHVQMSGADGMPPGAKAGAGAAVVAFHGPSKLCWRFAHLHGFTSATSARVDVGAAGRDGQAVIVLSPGPRLHHQGCVQVSPALSKQIVSQPGGYYLSIQSKQYPQGAVRARL